MSQYESLDNDNDTGALDDMTNIDIDNKPYYGSIDDYNNNVNNMNDNKNKIDDDYNCCYDYWCNTSCKKKKDLCCVVCCGPIILLGCYCCPRWFSIES